MASLGSRAVCVDRAPGPLVLVKPMGQGLRQPGTRFVPLQMESLRLSAGFRLLPPHPATSPPAEALARGTQHRQVESFPPNKQPGPWASLQAMRVAWVDILRSVQDVGTSTGCGVSERDQHQWGPGRQNPAPECPRWLWTWASGGGGDIDRTYFLSPQPDDLSSSSHPPPLSGPPPRHKG